MPVRTSKTHPIRVDFVPKHVHGLAGQLGMTFAPGKKAHGLDGRWERDLSTDLGRLRGEYGTDVLVSLVEEDELEKLGMHRLDTTAAETDLVVDRFGIPDGGVPADAGQFAALVARTLSHVRSGRTVVIHCRGGLGRTGVLAATCLRAVGLDAERAIDAVRAARPGTIENLTQEDFVRTATLPVSREMFPTLSRIRGCLLGGALGDALGEPVEFISSAHEILRRFGVNAPAKLGYAHGPFITDDTQMTLFAAEGIIRAGRVRWDDRASLARSVQAGFLRWYSTQRGSDSEVVASSPAGWLVTQRGLHHQRAPGNTCMSALQAQVGAKKLASVASPLNSSKGCGAIMRAAPFGLAARTRAQAFQWGRDTGAITHGHPSGYLSAGHFAAVIWGISRGEPLATSIEQATALLAGEANHAETSAAVSRAMSLVANGPPTPSTIESLGGAWVGEEALAIALLCTATCEGSSPEAIAETLWRAVAHAGDSDSTGSMVGNLLGAMHGYEALPAAWLEELELVGVIDRIAGDLHAALSGKVDEHAYPVKQTDMRASADEPEKKIEWHGILSREVCSEWFLQARDALADAAKASDWPAVFRVLEEHPKLINSWRAGGKSWYAPLHQAAHGGASVDIVDRLLSLGAWRTLANAKGERPVDIAQRQGHEHLVPQLEPVAVRRVDAQAVERMQGHFHSVIRTRIAVLEGVAGALRLPELAPLTEYPNAKAWFAVPGMYGGFTFWLEADGAQPKLVSESWCRVVEGSEERHEVTPGGARLVIGRP